MDADRKRKLARLEGPCHGCDRRPCVCHIVIIDDAGAVVDRPTRADGWIEVIDAAIMSLTLDTPDTPAFRHLKRDLCAADPAAEEVFARIDRAREWLHAKRAALGPGWRERTRGLSFDEPREGDTT